jgi:peptidyl-dipeptidase A
MSRLSRLPAIGVIVFSSGIFSPPRASAADTTAAARTFVRDHESKIQPLEIEIARAWWMANTTGKDEDFAAKAG